MSVAEMQERVQSAEIEARLDSIERILIHSGMSRSERIAIVQSVEDQILEMLKERGADLSRDAVLSVLRELDPPEAYCDEGHSATRASIRSRRATESPHSTASSFRGQPESSYQGRKYSGFAITAFVLAMISIPTAILIPIGTGLAILGAIFAGVAIALIGQSNGKLIGTWMVVTAFSLFGLHVTAAITLTALGLFS